MYGEGEDGVLLPDGQNENYAHPRDARGREEGISADLQVPATAGAKGEPGAAVRQRRDPASRAGAGTAAEEYSVCGRRLERDQL